MNIKYFKNESVKPERFPLPTCLLDCRRFFRSDRGPETLRTDEEDWRRRNQPEKSVTFSSEQKVGNLNSFWLLF